MFASAWASLLQAATVFAVSLVLLRAFLSFKSLLFILSRIWRWVEERTQAYQSFHVPRYADDSLENPLYRKAAAYLSSLPSAEDSDHTDLFSSSVRPNDFSVQLSPSQTVDDSFRGVRLSWSFLPSTSGGDRLVLRLRRQDRYRVLRPYLQHVETAAEDIYLRRKDLKLYTNAGCSTGRRWRSTALTHPTTLDTVVMEPEIKARVRADLESFLKGHAYYSRLGRVWKRSYLLQGPPGTGKSSFVAAMARFLCYDIYELDLSLVSDAADLRALLLETTPRSLILVEDVDRYLAGGVSAVEMSALLDFMDGVFSCCAEERVIVFTASREDTFDPALIRPGRLDVHINFPLCDFTAFKTLASSYLGLKDHKLYPQVEEGFQTGAKLSPAEIGEIMIANRGSPSKALKSVINALHRSASFGAAEKMLYSSFSTGSRRISEEINVKDTTAREFRKLYGLIRLRNGSKREGAIPAEVADYGGNNHIAGVEKST